MVKYLSVLFVIGLIFIAAAWVTKPPAFTEQSQTYLFQGLILIGVLLVCLTIISGIIGLLEKKYGLTNKETEDFMKRAKKIAAK
jgi:uncharacterized membrane protein